MSTGNAYGGTPDVSRPMHRERGRAHNSNSFRLLANSSRPANLTTSRGPFLPVRSVLKGFNLSEAMLNVLLIGGAVLFVASGPIAAAGVAAVYIIKHY